MKTKQNRNTIGHRVAAAVTIVLAVAVIVLAVMQIFELWNGAVNVAIPLLGLIQLASAYSQWDVNRRGAYVSIAAAVVIAICAGAVFFLK